MPGVVAVLVYAVSLVVAVLVSQLAQRTVLSTAVLFLASGFLVGDGMLGLVVLRPEHPVVWWLVEIALFTVLFTDGMQTGLRDLASAWRLPGRALLLGLPLTLLVTAGLAHWVVGLTWLQALLVGAALSATDHLIALVVVLSIVAHSSTDVLVARWFRRVAERQADSEQRAAA